MQVRAGFGPTIQRWYRRVAGDFPQHEGARHFASTPHWGSLGHRNGGEGRCDVQPDGADVSPILDRDGVYSPPPNTALTFAPVARTRTRALCSAVCADDDRR